MAGLLLSAVVPTTALGQYQGYYPYYRVSTRNAVGVAIPPALPQYVFRETINGEYLGTLPELGYPNYYTAYPYYYGAATNSPLAYGGTNYALSPPYANTAYSLGAAYTTTSIPYFNYANAFAAYAPNFGNGGYGGYANTGYGGYANTSYGGYANVGYWAYAPYFNTFAVYTPDFDLPPAAPPLPQPPQVLNLARASTVSMNLKDTPAAPSAGTATVTVTVPEGATVYVEGQALKSQTGTTRQFVSPALTPGKTYTYDIRATWTGPDGKKVERTVSVDVRAGARESVMFMNTPMEK